MADVFPRFLFVRLFLCVVLFDINGFVGDTFECTIPPWVNVLCIILGILFSAHLCLRLVVGARALEMLKQKHSSE